MVASMRDVCRISGTMAKPKPVNVSLDKDVHDELRRVARSPEVDRSINECCSRVMRWFCLQQPAVRSAVLSAPVPGLEGQHADVIQSIAADVRAGRGVSRGGNRELVRDHTGPPSRRPASGK